MLGRPDWIRWRYSSEQCLPSGPSYRRSVGACSVLRQLERGRGLPCIASVLGPGRDRQGCAGHQWCMLCEPESYQLPLLESIRFSSPLRECSSVIGGFSLDIHAAHKTVRVRERDRGLLGVGLQNGDSYRFFFYKVCPFGATFSSHWFQRVSGFLVRFLHVLIWVRTHAYDVL